MSGALSPVSILGSLLAMVIDVWKNVRLIPSKATISSNVLALAKITPRIKHWHSFTPDTSVFCDFVAYIRPPDWEL